MFTSQVSIHGLWPTYIMEVKTGDRFKSSIDKVIDDVVFYDTPAGWGRTHKISKTSSEHFFCDDVIADLNLVELQNEIDYLVREYCLSVGIQYTNYVRTSWFSLFEEGDYAHIHNHMSASISGCYYYETNQNDGNIFFKTPLPQLYTNPAFVGLSNRVEVQAENGKFLLFPGWLEHGVSTNETKDRRISLSFNIEFDYLSSLKDNKG